MKTNETIAVVLNKDDSALLTECGLRGGTGTYGGKIPRLIINTSCYSDDGACYPAQSVVLYNEPVRKLYDALKEYFEKRPLETDEAVLIADIGKGLCPDCKAPTLQEGPSGGLMTNIQCSSCGARFNYCPPCAMMLTGKCDRL